jgi:hypothetical protein
MRAVTEVTHSDHMELLPVLRIIPLTHGRLDVVAESFTLLNRHNIALLNTAFGSDTQPT